MNSNSSAFLQLFLIDSVRIIWQVVVFFLNGRVDLVLWHFILPHICQPVHIHRQLLLCVFLLSQALAAAATAAKEARADGEYSEADQNFQHYVLPIYGAGEVVRRNHTHSHLSRVKNQVQLSKDAVTEEPNLVFIVW